MDPIVHFEIPTDNMTHHIELSGSKKNEPSKEQKEMKWDELTPAEKYYATNAQPKPDSSSIVEDIREDVSQWEHWT